MTNFFLFLVKIYQFTFSPDHGIWRRIGRGCRFYPSCSDYACEALKKFGILKGIWKSIGRISRCHPFSEGGYDPL